MREFLYSKDAARIIIDLMELSEKDIYKNTKGKFSHINIGIGKDYKISDLVKKLVKVSNFKGKVIYNSKYPDGVKRKLLNIKLLKKILPNSFSKMTSNNRKFDYYLKKEYLNLTENTLKKFEKNSSYNLPI